MENIGFPKEEATMAASNSIPSGDEVVQILREMLTWIRVTSLPQVKAILEMEFPRADSGSFATDRARKDAQIYQLAHSGKPQDTIAKEVGVSQSTVSQRFAKWEKVGLMKDKAPLFDLTDFGFEVPLPNLEGAENAV